MSSMEISEDLSSIVPDIKPVESKEQGEVSDENVRFLLQKIQRNTYNSPGRPSFISQENIQHELRIFNFPNNSEFADTIRTNAAETNAVIKDLKNTLWGIGEELLIREPKEGNSVSEESYYAAYGINFLAEVLSKTGNDEISYRRRLDKENKVRFKLSGDGTHAPDKVYIFESVPSRKRGRPAYIRWFIRPDAYSGEATSENGQIIKHVREARAKLEVFSPELPYKSVSLRIDSPLRYTAGTFEYDVIIGKNESNLLDQISLPEPIGQVSGHHFISHVNDTNIEPSRVYETIVTKLMQNTYS